MILIGSRALSYWKFEHNSNGKDWDIICSAGTAEQYVERKICHDDYSWKHGDVEFHNSKYFLNHDVSSLYWKGDFAETPIGKIPVCSRRGLAAIKRSHLWRRLDFTKNIIQYQLMDHDFNGVDRDFIGRRSKLIEEAFPQPTAPQNVSNREFFKDNVQRVFTHDDIHPIVAHYKIPIYEMLKSDHSKAECESDLWHDLSNVNKDRAVLEEIYVIALERWLIPSRIEGKKYPYKLALYKALEKCCTTLGEGFFRDHAIDNWARIVEQFDFSKLDRFFESELWKTRLL
jgi:hypothetical protein